MKEYKNRRILDLLVEYGKKVDGDEKRDGQ